MGNRIRDLRLAKGLSLEALAAQVGTTNQQISHLELGKRQLTVEWLRRLSRVLECHPWDLVETHCIATLPADETRLLDGFRALNPAERAELLDRLNALMIKRAG